MTISNQFAADLLNLVFNGTAITGIAQNHGTPNANVFFALHFDDPGEAGTQTTNAASYTSYARVARTRTNASGGMTAATATDPASTSPHTTNVDFPESTRRRVRRRRHPRLVLGRRAHVRRWENILERGGLTDHHCSRRGSHARLTVATAITLD